MAQSAHVTSITALTEFRGDLAVFTADAREALSANEMQIHRAFGWLEEQTRYWKQQLRARQEEVVQAKLALQQRKIFKVMGKPPDCTEQEMNLRKAQQRLREAEEKVEATKRWATALRRHVEEYEAQARRLGSMLEADLPRVNAQLEQRIEALEAYVRMAPPSTPEPPAE